MGNTIDVLNILIATASKNALKRLVTTYLFMVNLFRGKKTGIFYIGLIALGFAGVVIFHAATTYLIFSFSRVDFSSFTFLPAVIIVLTSLIVGLILMSKGVEKESTTSSNNML